MKDKYSLDYNIKQYPQTGGLLIESLQIIVFALAISVVIYLFFAIPNQVDGQSMIPNLNDKDILLTNKFIQLVGGKDNLVHTYDYHRGDIVVFQEPNRPDLVKRIIGLPGETIKVENGEIFINGKLLLEDYLPPEFKTDGGTFLIEGKEKTISPDSYAVFGDNRLNSKDSRSIDVGFVKRKYIKGKVFIRVMPIKEFGLMTPPKYSWESENIDYDNINSDSIQQDGQLTNNSINEQTNIPNDQILTDNNKE